ncbi:hypothetical protein EJA23_07720 [Salmonella enterica subsp. enterica serovar Newport]|nr:hypothetical protein [Salmonella enterica subsp. enterica serovar Newport]EDC6158489.1 hypothetical protein [Salmonella enterica subsp. enterica serovar Newport]EDE2478643.1 hypothetical protein [Salmonella enterica subsp. enterica serovar Newport]EDH1199536.1 hypothetical protein [Salmonella enterica subsp. enterica serovar Newport]EDH3981849.1 hypothetical protein [Salmonella enterica subsp. enterica serovar Newport]
MNTSVIRTYTEQLESTIEKGVELRDSMRQEISRLERLVKAQKSEITNAVNAKELYQRRLGNYKKRLIVEREKRQKLEGQIIKLKRRMSNG